MTGMRYKRYLLVLLLVTYAFNNVDRLVLGLVLQDIKLDLNLTDTQLGYLTGLAFALFYSVMGLPIARWADRGNRIVIISITTALWSVMLALSAAASNFIQLMLIRVGVAVGEAGCLAPSQSLLADHFDRAERPRAFALFMLAGPLSVLLAYLVGGWLNEHYGWRMTFVLIGAPGLILSVLTWLTLREPRVAKHTSVLDVVPSASPVADLGTVLRTLWKIRTFRHLVLCFAILLFFSSGIQQWQPAFFMRTHGLKTAELGAWFAAIFASASLIGIYLGGEWASRFAAGNESLQLKVAGGMYCLFGVVSALVYLSPWLWLAFALLFVATLLATAANGPLFAMIQTLVPERMRATAIAALLLVANLIGMGLGPLATGGMSDLFRPWAGEDSLRYALIALSPGYFWCMWHVLRASRTIAHDMQATTACIQPAFAP
jgi:MFS family permease